MINYSSLISSITYDPISWIEPSYLDSQSLHFSTNEKRVFNDIMINAFNFPPISLEKLTQFEKELIAFWPVLSHAFMFMAYFRFKAVLPSSFRRLKLNKDEVQFALALSAERMQSPILKTDLNMSLTRSTLQQQAFQEMTNFLTYCSDPIRKRLPFFFSAATKQHNAHLVAEKADFLLLRITCHYARSRYSA